MNSIMMFLEEAAHDNRIQIISTFDFITKKSKVISYEKMLKIIFSNEMNVTVKKCEKYNWIDLINNDKNAKYNMIRVIVKIY